MENNPNQPDSVNPDKKSEKEFDLLNDLLKEGFKADIKAEKEGKIIPEINPVVLDFMGIMKTFRRNSEMSVNGLVDIEKTFEKPMLLRIFNEEGNVERVEVDNFKKVLEIYIEQMEKFRSKVSERDKKMVDDLLMMAKMYLAGV